MAESSGWVSSPKQRSPQFEHLDSVICRSLRLSINISMGTKQQVSYLITAMMAAKIRFRSHMLRSVPGVVFGRRLRFLVALTEQLRLIFEAATTPEAYRDPAAAHARQLKSLIVR
jgi:hypothetical protein